MVLESLSNPFKAEKNPSRQFFYGFSFCSIGLVLAYWIFKSQSSLIMVFFTAMACIPLIYSTIKFEEEKDISGMKESFLLKEHSKALRVFMFLFLGATVAFAFWYVLLSAENISVIFNTQSSTINSINSNVVGYATFGLELQHFSKIFFNNVKVLIFCILFSFVYGAGAIFILMWNASVIGVAIGNFVRTELSKAASLIGFDKVAHYFQVISFGLLKYSIHGIPEILAYFVGGLAGGIIGIAVIRHDFNTKRFENIVLDSADLLLLSLGILFVAAILEVWVTPLIF